MRFSPASPTVGDDVTITIDFSDPDAPSTSNCRTIDVDGARAFADPCTVPQCTSSGQAAGGGVGGTAEVTFHHTWTDAGEHTVTAHGESVQPYCHDRYGDQATATATVNVAAAATSTTSAPTTASPVSF